MRILPRCARTDSFFVTRPPMLYISRLAIFDPKDGSVPPEWIVVRDGDILSDKILIQSTCSLAQARMKINPMMRALFKRIWTITMSS
ncbi:hypothetical protein CY34DRAFT_813342 [Suillus luteus UH-Slu-Lm8-n1]|uniref:Unplaced genomic scaffold CY34scaffold_730, whole genome shotgun sequence n=1 Tax=Suillus luteus UH-Slu-Lm8-n1 TaxID=930992 RepID=A0A0D0APC9_9AGAM|nr:hypothetical protein CY34DRAFT_813342 [Suillus luteus UH-Slu-Lm8-n1]